MDINIVKLKKYAAECSVLYVEDDEVIRDEIASFLGRFFPDVVLAEDGAIGLNKYKERSFDVVITDINMPNMNGIEMIEAIKEEHYEQTILVTSAYNDSENLMKLLDLDINRFILKPFNNKQFLYVLYKIAEELSLVKEKERLEDEVTLLSSRSQVILDQVQLGIIVLRDNELTMANRAFLELAGFDSYETFKLEMPDVSVLFEKATHCISAFSHEEFIEELYKAKEENRKVRIIRNSRTIEY
ncbi:MAG: response regulator [Campylobacterota bacterium]|nr:response regulator [Campylobacterota bacterium]